MRIRIGAWPVFAALLGLAGCSPEDFGSFSRYSEDFHYSYPLQSGGKLSIESFNGSVELSGWDQDTVDISGTKFAPSSEAAGALKIEIDNRPDSVSLRVVRPSDFRSNRGARFLVKMPRKAVVDRITTTNGAIRVEQGSGPARLRTSNAIVRVSGLEGNVDVQTSNGSIEVADMAGDVVARTSNGSIRAMNLKGELQATTSNAAITTTLEPGQSVRPVRLETSNGSVDVTLRSLASDVRINSSNGRITLHLPSPLNARLSARTTNSSIVSDFEIKSQGTFGRNQMDGTLGMGGPLLDLNTSNGSIRLLKM